MRFSTILYWLVVVILGFAGGGGTAVLAAPEVAEAGKAEKAGLAKTYILTANDMVEMKVYQEDDLSTKLRIAKDGTASIPLIGVVPLGGKTVEEASVLIRKLLDKDYLVNPQVTLTVVEYAKRRFTVLGQVQKPGSYEIPNEESTTLLQAIAMAGGYTRLANSSKVVVTRVHSGKKTNHTLDAKALANGEDANSFQILPGDTITVAERFF